MRMRVPVRPVQASFSASVRYGLDTLGVLARFTADRHGRSWTLLRRPAVAVWLDRALGGLLVLVGARLLIGSRQ